MADHNTAIPVDDYKEFDDVIAYPLKLKTALNKVVSKIPDQWHNAGKLLGIKEDKLTTIKCDLQNDGNPINFFKSVLIAWEENPAVPYNWGSLLKCISSDLIGKKSLAKEIAKELSSSERKLTAGNAFQLLKSCEFRVVSNWSKLAATLGVPLEDRKRLRTQTLIVSNYDDCLEECLDIWIKNDQHKATWDELFKAVAREERVTSKRMRDTYMEWKGL